MYWGREVGMQVGMYLRTYLGEYVCGNVFWLVEGTHIRACMNRNEGSLIAC